MFGLFKSLEYSTKLHELYAKLKPSKEVGVCIKCSYCCWVKPGCLNKTDLKKLANHLNISEKEVFKKYLAVDNFGKNGAYVLLPIREDQQDIAGQFVPTVRTWDIETPCVFLDKSKKCTLHNKAKPMGCRKLKHGENENPSLPTWSKEDLIDLGWDGEE